MLAIPSSLRTEFENHLRNKSIEYSMHGLYKKWLQYYLDFCLNYHFSPIHQESLSHFIHKLQEKNQTKVQQEQAMMAIRLYYEISDARGFLINKAPMPQPTRPLKDTPLSARQNVIPREEPTVPLQKENVVLRSSSVSVPGLREGNSAGIVGPSGRVDVEGEKGASWKAEYSRLADEIQLFCRPPYRSKTSFYSL